MDENTCRRAIAEPGRAAAMVLDGERATFAAATPYWAVALEFDGAADGGIATLRILARVPGGWEQRAEVPVDALARLEAVCSPPLLHMVEDEPEPF